MLTDTVPLSLITEANIFNQTVQEKNRREEARKNLDFFYSKQEKYVTRINSDVEPITVNILNPIVKKRNTLLYSRPLKREYKGSAKSIAYIESLFNKLKIDYILRSADLAAELTGTGLVYIGVDEDGKIYLKVYDGSEISVIQDTDYPLDPFAISIVTVIEEMKGDYKNPNVSQYIRQQIWTDEYVTTYNGGSRLESIPNEIGWLPFSAFKGEDVYNQFLGHAPAEGIQQLNGYYNQQLTNLGYMIKMQSASPLALTGFENGEGVKIHPGAAINLPNGATATVLNFDPKIKDTLDTIKYIEEKIYETSSIPKVSIIGDAESKSGRELMIKWSPLISVFKEKALRYQQYELNLVNRILQLANLEPIDEMLTHYPEESILPLTDKSDRDSDIKYGLITPVDELLKMYPAMTIENAEKIIRDNIAFNNEIAGMIPETIIVPR